MAKKKSDSNNVFSLSNLKYTNKALLIVSLLLFVFGLIMIFSSSSVSAFVRYHKNPYYFAVRQGAILIGGIIIFLIASNVETESYSKLSWLGVLASIGLLLFACFNGVVANDTLGWIKLGPVKFQPSEIAKIMLIAWTATFFEIKKIGINKMAVSMFYFAVSYAFAGLIVLANDFGTAIIIAAIAFGLYMLIPINGFVKWKSVTIALVVGITVLLGYYFFDTSSFQRQTSRLMNFTEPCSEKNFYSTGNQVCNSIIAINNGNLTGMGLGNSTQKYLYLPESHTDFIFAIVVEETGLIGGILTVGCILTVIMICIYIGSRSPTFRGSIICYGTAIYIFLHTAINLCGIMGVIPLTGVPLPFISYGGTFAVCLMSALSMVQRVAIETRKSKLGKR